jgi:hypothetical protein
VSNVRTAGIGVGLLVGLTLSVLLMLMATASAQAQTAGSCQEEFTVLRTHTGTVLITGGKIDKERAGLLKLVDDAETLASIGKSSDAVKKLGDFTVKVDQLEAAGRISAESADQLRSDAQATIVCLQGSEVSTTVGAVN